VRGGLRALVLLLASLAACGDGGTTRPLPKTGARFAIHEWGLIAVPRGGDSLTALAMTGAQRPYYRPMPLGEHFEMGGLGLRGLKPVIYVHVEGGGAAELSVRVGAPQGKMIEVLPPSAAGPADEARWNGLRASGASCRSSVPARVPPCRTEDRYCEALEDPFFDTTDASCLHLRSGGTRNHLFYRARIDGAPLPFAVSWSADAALIVRNSSRHVVAGPAFRISQADDGRVLFARFDPSAPGTEVTVPRPPVADVAAARAAIVAAIRARGLTEQEARAFDRAWAHVLLDAPLAPEIAALALGETPGALEGARDVVLYLLSDELAARVLPLGVEPRPTAVHRAMFVRMDVSAPDPVRVADAPPDMRTAARDYAVAQGETSARGALSSEVVRRVIRRHAFELRSCAATSSTPLAHAEMTVELTISAQGSVILARVRDVDQPDAPVPSCVVDAVRRWTFPAAAAETRATQTLRFEHTPAP